MATRHVANDIAQAIDAAIIDRGARLYAEQHETFKLHYEDGSDFRAQEYKSLLFHILCRTRHCVIEAVKAAGYETTDLQRAMEP